MIQSAYALSYMQIVNPECAAEMISKLLILLSNSAHADRLSAQVCVIKSVSNTDYITTSIHFCHFEKHIRLSGASI